MLVRESINSVSNRVTLSYFLVKKFRDHKYNKVVGVIVESEHVVSCILADAVGIDSAICVALTPSVVDVLTEVEELVCTNIMSCSFTVILKYSP